MSGDEKSSAKPDLIVEETTEVQTGVQFLENPPVLVGLHQQLLGMESEIDHLDFGSQLTKNDFDSYDCYSFSVLTLDNVFHHKIADIPKLDTRDKDAISMIQLEDVVPQLRVNLKKMLFDKVMGLYSEESGQQYHQALKKFIKEFLDNSINFPIRKDDNNFSHKEFVNDIVDYAQHNPVSRVLLIYSPNKEVEGELHLCFMVGSTEDNNDIWVLEKSGIGEKIKVSTLTEVVRAHRNNPLYKEMPLEIALLEEDITSSAVIIHFARTYFEQN